VWEPRDLVAFPTIDEACSYVEPEDIEAVIGFDGEGRKFRFGEAELPIAAFGGRLGSRRGVSVVSGDVEPSHADELKNILLMVLSEAGHAVDDATPFQELVQQAAEIFLAR
jgi:hypothetical protein